MVKKFKLANGLRVVFVPQASPTATAMVLVEAGSEYETKKINGLSHFLEHLCFKGTKKRPKPGMISRELDSLGAESNAFTNQEYTGYWAKVEKKNFEKILEIVADLYLNPIFNPEEIDKERGVVIEELNMYEDTPMRKVEEIWHNLVYGDQPAGWDIGGTKKLVSGITREEIIKYRSEHYVAAKTVVVIAGNVNVKKTRALVQKYFGILPKTARLKKGKTKASAKGPKAIVKFKKSEQDHLVLGVPGFDIFDKRRYALYVLASVLGYGMSSRLFHKIREELGAAYYVRANSSEGLDHGEFSVATGTANSKTETVIKAILKEFARLKVELVPPKELQKAKDIITSGMVMGLETSDQLANFYGIQEILVAKTMSPEEMSKRINTVTAEDVRTIARTIFKKEKLNLAIIGPYKGDKKFKKLLSV
ncbi:MAG: Uncharacterized protein LiPW15_497 [Parcubacteria group bacterium LiPW_15]|nr:MAG: Uncharacterized protein LiPW15_497 [Parcubacteria group bacterium LiPW_15]